MAQKTKSTFLKLFYVLQSNLLDEKRKTLGKILTIIDACTPDTEQRKGIKDLITQSFWQKIENETERLEIVIGQFIRKFYPREELSEDEKEFLIKKLDKELYQNYFPDSDEPR